MHCSRRSALQLIGSAGALATTAGCVEPGSSGRYTLVATGIGAPSLGESFLLSDPLAVDADARVDFTDGTKRQYLEDLFETGRVTVREWPLVARDAWGTDTRPRPTFLRRDGRYYEVRVENRRQVDEDRWLFGFERTDDGLPDDATVASEPFTGLSELDRRVVRAALDAVYAGHDGFVGDPEFDELQAVEYHRDLPADGSGLVPSPPFDFVEAEREFFRAVTDWRTVPVPEWTFSIEPIGDSVDHLEASARETVPDARFDGVSGSARKVLDASVGERDGRPYEEDAPLSDGLSEVIGGLGIADDLRPLDGYGDRTAFRGAVASYGGEWYRFDLLVEP